jgi:hypothetical protein
MDDDRADVYAHFEIVGQPAVVVIDSAGQTRTLLGALDEDALTQVLTDVTAGQ